MINLENKCEDCEHKWECIFGENLCDWAMENQSYLQTGDDFEAWDYRYDWED